MRPVAPPTAVIHFRFADALRSIAIVSVVLSHIVMVIPCLRPLVPFRLALGSWGVDAFFVLSGFLLGRPYVDALLGRRPLPNWRRYARRRFLRIWPAYAAVVVFAFAKTLVHHGASAHAVADTITHLLMIHNFFPAFVTGADNIALWTMAVDAQFYVVLPLVAWALFRRTATHLRPDVLIVLACVVILSLTWRLTVPFFSADTAQSVLGVQRNLIGMGTSFAVGVFLAYLSAQAIAPAPGQARVLVAAALTLTCADYATAASFPGLFKDFALDMLGTIGVGLIVFAVPHIAWPPLDRALGSRVVAIAAANAYALYLVHVPIKQTVDSFVVARGITPNTTAYGIAFSLGFCICCGIAVPLLHNFVELPFLTLKERARETFVVSTERINAQGTTRRLGS